MRLSEKPTSNGSQRISLSYVQNALSAAKASSSSVDDVKPATEFDSALTEALSRLQSEDVAFDEVRQIREACNLYEIERMDSTNLVLRKARDAIVKAVAKIRKNGSMPPRLADAIAFVALVVEKQTSVIATVKSSQYRSAMILMALYGF